MLTAYKKSILILFLIGILSFILYGCASSPDNVNLKSQKQADKYVRKNFGNAEYKSVIKGNKSIKYIFSDKTFGFDFYVESSVSEINIDGSTFGYTEKTVSNFKDEYYKCFIKQSEYLIKELEDKNNIEIILTDYPDLSDMHIFEVHCRDNNEEIGKQSAMVLMSKAKEFDKYSHWDNAIISIFSKDDSDLGSVYFKSGEFVSQKQEEINLYMQHAESKCNGKIKFMYSEKMLIKDVPGLENHKRSYKIDEDINRTETVVYYFSYNKKTYFICDILVEEGQFYCNYN